MISTTGLLAGTDDNAVNSPKPRPMQSAIPMTTEYDIGEMEREFIIIMVFQNST